MMETEKVIGVRASATGYVSAETLSHPLVGHSDVSAETLDYPLVGRSNVSAETWAVRIP